MKDTFYDLYCEEVKKNEILKKEIVHLKIENASLTRRIVYLESHQEEIIEKKVKVQVDKAQKAFEGRLSAWRKKWIILNLYLTRIAPILVFLLH